MGPVAEWLATGCRGMVRVGGERTGLVANGGRNTSSSRLMHRQALVLPLPSIQGPRLCIYSLLFFSKTDSRGKISNKQTRGDMASQQKQPRYRTRAVAGREPCRGPEVWTPDLVERIAAFLPRNEVAVTLRLVNMATAALLSTFKAVRVAEPLPAYCYEHSEQYPPLRDVFRGSAKRRKQLVRAAARSGSLEVVDVALEASGLSPGGWLFAAAAGGKGAHGAALALCKRLLAMGCPSEDSQSGGHDRFPTALEEAAAAGNADVCAWLLAGGRQLCQWDKGAVYAAARSGHAGLVFWLQSHPMASAQAKRSFCVDQLLTAAAHGCKLPDLQRIYQHWLGGRPPRPPHLPGQQALPDLSFGTFAPGYFERRPDGFVCDHRDYTFSNILAAAAGSPTACWLEKLDGLMRWHCGEGTDQLLGSCRNELCRIFRGAMSRPDGVSRVRLLWEERGWRPGDGLTAAVGEAATRCDAAAVAFLFEELGAEMQADDMYGLSYPPLTGPIQAGDLRFLQLMLRTYRVRCRSKRFYCLVLCAAEAGHLAILRWLFEWAAERERVQGNDVPRHYYIEDALQNGLRRAIRNGHAAAVRFLLGQGARLEPGPPWWLEAARSGSVETLRVLAESGYAPNVSKAGGGRGSRGTGAATDVVRQPSLVGWRAL